MASSLLKYIEGVVNADQAPLFDPLEDIDDLNGLLAAGLTEKVIMHRIANSPNENGLWVNWEDFVYSNEELYSFERMKRNLDYETILNKTGASVDKVPCPRCGNTNTSVAGTYKRAADEPGVSEYICSNCNKKFQAE